MRKQFDTIILSNSSGVKIIAEDTSSVLEPENTDNHHKDRNCNLLPDSDDNLIFQESDVKSGLFSTSSSIYQLYEIKMAALIRKNGILEGQLAVASASREAAEKNLSSVLKSKQEMEMKLADTLKEMELMREKLASVEQAQDDASSLSNIVHSDNVRLEHDVAFLKAVLDDTQKVLYK